MLTVETVKVGLDTEFGRVMLVLETKRAPISSRAFLSAVDSGAYTGGAFTRVVQPSNDHGSPKISVVQGGARDGAPGVYTVAHESTGTTGLRHLNGTISLPRGAAGTATGGGFFICIGDQPGLDEGVYRNQDGLGFAAFGRVTAGMEIAHRILGMDASGPSDNSYTIGQMLSCPVPILSAVRVS